METALSTIAYLISDLMFATRVEDTAKYLGYRVIALSDDVEATLAREKPGLVVVSLDSADCLGVIRASKSAGVRVLAFGSHKNIELMQSAKAAGADQVVARSLMVAELPNLLKKHIKAK